LRFVCHLFDQCDPSQSCSGRPGLTSGGWNLLSSIFPQRILSFSTWGKCTCLWNSIRCVISSVGFIPFEKIDLTFAEFYFQHHAKQREKKHYLLYHLAVGRLRRLSIPAKSGSARSGNY